MRSPYVTTVKGNYLSYARVALHHNTHEILEQSSRHLKILKSSILINLKILKFLQHCTVLVPSSALRAVWMVAGLYLQKDT